MSSSSWVEEASSELDTRLTNPTVENEPMAVHTTWGVGGPVSLMAEVVSSEEIQFVADLTRRLGVELRVVGCGSNLLVSDGGFDGVVVKLGGGLRRIEVMEDGAILAGAGARLPRLADIAAQKGLTGAEFCCGIPGTVGGAAKMNAGAHGADTSGILYSASWIETDTMTLKTEKPEMGYRDSSIGTDDILVDVEFRLEAGEKSAVEDTMAEYSRMRRSRQPLGRTAGSVFRNPEGDSAGRLVEASGAKGLRIGGAVVSEKHANFIINDGDATAAELMEVITEVQSLVYRESEIHLELEVELLGFGE